MAYGSGAICNAAMERLLTAISLDELRPRSGSLIWRKQDVSGRPYWGVGRFWGLEAASVGPDADLMELEWNGNEVRLDDSKEPVALVRRGLETLLAWREQLARDWPESAFYLLLSLDWGEDEIPPSVTLRFWAVREGAPWMEPVPAELEKFDQPVRMEWVNIS